MRFKLNLVLILLLFIFIFSTFVFASDVLISPSEIRAGEEVLFDAINYLDSSNDGGTFHWEFGDGYSVRDNGGVAVTHIYSYAGTYQLELTITDELNETSSYYENIIITGDYIESAPHLSGNIFKLKFEGDLIDKASNFNCVQNCDLNYTSSSENKGAIINTKTSFSSSYNSNLDTFTISFWMRRHDIAAPITIFEIPGVMKYNIPDRDDGYRYYYTITTDDEVDKRFSCTWGAYSHDLDWHHHLFIYDGSTLEHYVDGASDNNDPDKGDYCLGGDLTGSINLNNPNVIFSDDSGNSFDIDEFRIYNQVFGPTELLQNLELVHADYHARLAQYIYYSIPKGFQSNDFNAYVEIIGDNSYSEILLNEPIGSRNEIKFLLNNSKLPSGNYEVVYSIIDNSNGDAILAQGKEYFSKNYNGAPKVGINENNAIVYKGELFFPVTPWGIDIINKYGDSERDWPNSINTFYGEGFWINTEYGSGGNLDSWKEYLNQIATYGQSFPIIGPSQHGASNCNTTTIKSYVTETKDDPSSFMWQWRDEPDLYAIPSPVIRAWTKISHDLDSQKPVATNYAGFYWVATSGWGLDHRQNYQYLKNTNYGKRFFPADVLGFDYYPVEWAEGFCPNKDATNDKLILALEHMRNETMNLVPYFSFVETTDIHELGGSACGIAEYPTPWSPTNEVIYMTSWINVIHGAKGINWFHHRSRTPIENFESMAKFRLVIEDLKDIVLSKELNFVVTDNANIRGNRVDTMVKEFDGNYWLFAVRVSETVERIDDDMFEDITDIDVEFNIPESITGTINVYNESRIISISGGIFSDTFEPGEVHIYQITDENYVPPLENCFDGILNQDETGVDCGGVCDACVINQIHDADTDSSGTIEIAELNILIQKWRSSNTISLANLIEAIRLWKGPNNDNQNANLDNRTFLWTMESDVPDEYLDGSDSTVRWGFNNELTTSQAYRGLQSLDVSGGGYGLAMFDNPTSSDVWASPKEGTIRLYFRYSDTLQPFNETVGGNPLGMLFQITGKDVTYVDDTNDGLGVRYRANNGKWVMSYGSITTDGYETVDISSNTFSTEPDTWIYVEAKWRTSESPYMSLTIGDTTVTTDELFEVASCNAWHHLLIGNDLATTPTGFWIDDFEVYDVWIE